MSWEDVMLCHAVHQLFVIFKKKWDESPLLRSVAGLLCAI
jgi:hypothetical protein